MDDVVMYSMGDTTRGMAQLARQALLLSTVRQDNGLEGNAYLISHKASTAAAAALAGWRRAAVETRTPNARARAGGDAENSAFCCVPRRVACLFSRPLSNAIHVHGHSVAGADGGRYCGRGQMADLDSLTDIKQTGAARAGMVALA